MTKPAIPEQALESHLAILAKTGAGKSFAARGFLEWLLAQGRRICVIDPIGVHWGIRLTANGKKPAPHQVVIFGGDHGDVEVAPTAGAELAKVIATSNLPAVVDVSLMGMGERHRFFTDFANALMRHNRTPLHLVIDECHEFMPQSGYGEKSVDRGKMINAGNRLVSGGRARGLRIMLISQRAAKVHKDSLTQVETLIIMRLMAKQDRDAAKGWVEACADPGEWAKIERSLPRLEVGTGWVWAPALDVLDQVHFPLIDTFDSFKAPDESTADAAPLELADVDLGALREQLGGKKKAGKGGASTSKASAQGGGSDQLRQVVAEQRGETQDLRAALQRSEREVGCLVAAMERAAQALTEAVQASSHRQANGGHIDRTKDLAAHHRARDAGIIDRKTPPPLPPTAARATPAEPVDGITAPQQRLLDALAALETLGLSVAPKATLAAFAGVKPTSGGYANNLGRLRSAGLIEYPEGGHVGLTGSGRAAAAPAEQVTLHELHERWLAVVTAPQARILRALIDIYPNEVAKDSLAEAVGVSPTSGGYANNLGRLRTLGCIDYPTPGYARAAEILFPGEQ